MLVQVQPDSASLTPESIRASRYDLVSRIADDLSHEIKNPLHSMVINLELVRHRVASGAAEDALRRVDIVAGEVQRVHRLVEALIQFLRPTRETAEVTDVEVVLREAEPLLEAEAHVARIALTLTLPGGGSFVRADRGLLRHLVLLLFLTALGSARGGTLAIALERDEDEVRLLLTAAPGDAEGGLAETPDARLAGLLLQRAGGELDGGVEGGRSVLRARLPLARAS